MTTTAGAKGRRARYGEEMREDILQAARDIIAEEGAGALSIRGIARRINYSAPALYEYFAGKEAIAEALFIAGFRELARMMGQVTEPDPVGRVHALGIAYRAFAIAHPQEYSLMFSRPIPEFRPSPEDLRIATTAFAPLQHAFEEGIAAGVIRPMEARTGATAAWAFLHGLVSLELAGMGGPPPEHPLLPETVVPGHFPSLYDTALDLFGDAIRVP
ncbi:MAG TPA: TetR/AcrR family transcriptional regulator [Thermomicrobiales bacterium]